MWRSGQGCPRCAIRVSLRPRADASNPLGRVFRTLSKSEANGPKPEQSLQNPRMATFLRPIASAHFVFTGMGTDGIHGLCDCAVAFTSCFVGQHGSSSRVPKGRLRGEWFSKSAGIPLILDLLQVVCQIVDQQRRRDCAAQIDSAESASAIQLVLCIDRARTNAHANRIPQFEACKQYLSLDPILHSAQCF